MNEDSQSGMGFFGWLALALIVLGLLGVGPCAESCSGCGPQPFKQTAE